MRIMDTPSRPPLSSKPSHSVSVVRRFEADPARGVDVRGLGSGGEQNFFRVASIYFTPGVILEL